MKLNPKLVLLAVAVIAVPSTALARGADAYSSVPSEQRARYESEYQEAVAAMDKKVAQAEASLRRIRVPAQKRAAGEKLKELRAEADRLKKNDPPFLPQLPLAGLEVGLVGVLESNDRTDTTVECLQRTGDDEALVVPVFTNYRTQMRGNVPVPVPAGHSRGKVFKLRGVDMTNVADGQTLRLNGAFRVAETESYTAVNGAATTVHVVRPVDAADPFADPAERKN